MKRKHILIFLVVVAIVFAIIFYINRQKPIAENTLQYTVGCASDKIDSSVYKLRGDTSLIGAFISFDNMPINQETKDELQKIGVVLREDSQIFDYILAQIPTESLCTLAEYDYVVSVFIPEDN